MLFRSDSDNSLWSMGDSQNRNAPGTLPYMSPELFLGQPLSKKSDVFAFAISAWVRFTSLVSNHNETLINRRSCLEKRHSRMNLWLLALMGYEDFVISKLL